MEVTGPDGGDLLPHTERVALHRTAHVLALELEARPPAPLKGEGFRIGRAVLVAGESRHPANDRVRAPSRDKAPLENELPIPFKSLEFERLPGVGIHKVLQEREMHRRLVSEAREISQ